MQEEDAVVDNTLLRLYSKLQIDIMNRMLLRSTVIVLSGIMVFLWSYLVYSKIFPREAEISNASENANLHIIPTDFIVPQTTLTAQIKDCISEPEKIETSLDQFITLENTDTKEHEIKVDDAHTYSIPATGRGYIFMNFNNAAGTFPFTCDGASSGSFIIQQ